MIHIDYKDKRPIYEQIVEQFRLLILRGVLKKDDPMPSIRALAMEVSINPNTIQKAYQEMERLDYIYTVKGRGSFVKDSEIVVEQAVADIRGQMEKLIESAKDAGLKPDALIGMIEEIAEKEKDKEKEKEKEMKKEMKREMEVQS